MKALSLQHHPAPQLTAPQPTGQKKAEAPGAIIRSVASTSIKLRTSLAAAGVALEVAMSAMQGRGSRMHCVRSVAVLSAAMAGDDALRVMCSAAMVLAVH